MYFQIEKLFAEHCAADQLQLLRTIPMPGAVCDRLRRIISTMRVNRQRTVRVQDGSMDLTVSASPDGYNFDWRITIWCGKPIGYLTGSGRYSVGSLQRGCDAVDHGVDNHCYVHPEVVMQFPTTILWR